MCRWFYVLPILLITVLSITARDIPVSKNTDKILSECTPAFGYDTGDFGSGTDFSLIANAKVMNTQFIRLTDNFRSRKGAAWFKNKVAVRNGFITEFSFMVSDGYNFNTGENSQPGADGIAFVIQNASYNAIGDIGGYIGYGSRSGDGIPNCIAVEIDLFQNFGFGDLNGNHVAVMSRGGLPNSSTHSQAELKSNYNIPIIYAGITYYALVDYNIERYTLRVFISETPDFNIPAISIPCFNLSSYISLDKDSAWVGFTSGTGAAVESHDILSWNFCSLNDTIINMPHVTINSQGKTYLCNTDSVLLEVEPVDFAKYRYLWSTGDTSTSITVRQTGTYTVTLTDTSGCFKEGASITIKSFDQDIRLEGTPYFCYGDSTHIYGYPLGGEFHYLWSTGDTTPDIFVKKPGRYNLSIVNNNNCSASVSIDIFDTAAPKIKITGKTAFCEGESTNLIVSPYIKGFKYIWPTGETGQSITVNQPGKYIVTCVIGQNCQSSDTISIIMLPAITAKISGVKTVCEGDSILLTASPTGNEYQYFWTNGERKPFIYARSSGSYGLNVTNTGGCSSTDTVNIFFTPLPIARIIASGPTTFCEGLPITLSSAYSDPAYKYLWSTKEITKDITVYKAGTYKLVIVNSTGCKDSAAITIKTINFKAEIIPQGPTEFCSGDSVVLEALPIGSHYKYLWSTGEISRKIIVRKSGRYDVTVSYDKDCSDKVSVDVVVHQKPYSKISGPTSICEGDSTVLLVDNPNQIRCLWSTGDTTKHITVRTAGRYSVIVENIFGCKDSDNVIVKIENKLKAEIIGETSFCDGSSSILSALPNGIGYKYLWSTGDTASQITVSKTGRYWVYVSLNNKCSDSAFIDVRVNQNPSVKISGNTRFCFGEASILSINKIFPSVLWSTGETGQSITVSQAGKYKVDVIDSNGCKASDSINVQVDNVSITGLIPLNFGNIVTGKAKTDTVILKNESGNDVTINSIHAKINGNIFKIKTIPPPPLSLKEGQTLTIEVTFFAENAKDYTDTLLIEVSALCPKVYSSYLTGTGTGKTIVYVWLPDTSAKVGQKDFIIPLKLIYAEGNEISGLVHYNAVINIEAEAFQPDLVQKPGVIVKDSANGVRIITIEGTSEITKNETTLSEIKGTVLLGTKELYPLIISNFNWENPAIETKKKDGSLRIIGLCQQDLSKVRLINQYITIQPNPVTNLLELQINYPGLSDFNINIFNIQGNKLFNRFIINNSENISIFAIDVSTYQSGLYELVLTIGENVMTQTFLILK